MMDSNKRKELKVSAIRNGTVIDHIPSEKTFQVFKILNLEASNDPIYFGTSFESKKYGKKGIIKISNKYFEDDEISKVAMVAPTATLIEIRDYEVIRKEKVNLPEFIEKIVVCFNPKCITNIEGIETRFRVIEDHNGEMKLACHYCEKTMKKENIEFF
ncbi:MAG: aspartate carbamoyltransferase regulatory subunit [Bacteroidota bacterium]